MSDNNIRDFSTTPSVEWMKNIALPPVDADTKRIFWIRHGEVINPGGTRKVYYGAQDVPLSDFGKEEAKLAGLFLQQYPLSNVFSSTLSRAIYGAEQVLLYQQLKRQEGLTSPEDVTPKLEATPPETHAVQQLDGFKEMDRGSWAGKTIEEIGRENMKRFDACDDSVTPTGGESYRQLKRRVLDARDIALRTMACGTSAAVVSHLQVMRVIVSDARNIPIELMSQEVSIATASITCIDYKFSRQHDISKSTADGRRHPDDQDLTLECQTVMFQSFKPADAVGLRPSVDGAN